jgi:hypothetical protein
MRWVGNVAWRRGAVYTGFWWGNLRERDQLGGPGVDGRDNIKMDLQKWDGDLGWIDLAQDRDRWRALVTAVMTFGFHKMLSENRFAPQEGLCSVQ